MIDLQNDLVQLNLSRSPIYIEAIEALLINFTNSNIKALNLS